MLRSATLLGVLALVLTGCALTDPAMNDGDQRRPSALPRQVEPVEVPGVEPCSEIPLSTGESPQVDDRLAEFSLPCLTGRSAVDLAQLGGAPLVINLWATWCGPCRAEMPVLQDAYERYGGDVSFVGVNTKDDVRSAAAFLADVGVTYPQVVDLEGRLLGNLRSPGLPVTVVLDPDGAVTNRHVGPLTASSLRDLVEPTLADDGEPAQE